MEFTLINIRLMNYSKLNMFIMLDKIIYWIILLFVISVLSCNKEVHNPIDHFSESKGERLTHSKMIELDEFDILKTCFGY